MYDKETKRTITLEIKAMTRVEGTEESFNHQVDKDIPKGILKMENIMNKGLIRYHINMSEDTQTKMLAKERDSPEERKEKPKKEKK